MADDKRAVPEELARRFEKLPTGKPHISFSEVKCWHECGYRHKLQHVDRVGEDRPSVHMDFGTAIHAALEAFLKTGKMDERVFLERLHGLWKERSSAGVVGYTVDEFKQFASEGRAILPEIPGFIDKEFPGWEFVDAEHMLYEPISGHPHAFKGYIDAVIRAPGSRGQKLTWILDAKTCGWGWSAQKKSDPMVRAQVVLYKSFWVDKTGEDPANVRCGFLLLKRTAKPGNRCELIVTSAGDVTVKRSLTVVNSMITGVKKGLAIKNRNSCTFCQYYQTEHCT